MRYLLTAILLLTLSAPAHALTIDWEHQSGTRYSAPYGWQYGYDIAFMDNAIQVDLDVRLVGYRPADSLLSRWESGIESFWSTSRFDVPILFNVDWVLGAADQVVNVASGNGRWYMTNWFAGYADNLQERVAAHEFGHMLGLWDEYWGGAIDPVKQLVGNDGIMGSLGGTTLDYYYDPFIDWYHSKLPVDGPEPVPEPSTVMLLVVGLLAMGAVQYRRRAA